MSQPDSSIMHGLCTKILSSPLAEFFDCFCLFDESTFGSFQINSYLNCMHVKRPRALTTKEWRYSMVCSRESIFTLQYGSGDGKWCTILNPNSLPADHELLKGISKDELNAEHLMICGVPAKVVHSFEELPWLSEAVEILKRHASTLG